MTTENETKKKNPDYSATAVNLSNPPQVKEALDKLHEIQGTIAMLEKQQRQLNPGLAADLDALKVSEGEKVTAIRNLIDHFGSYQDTEKGEYALVYVRRTAQYNAYAFEARYPDHAKIVIVKQVNAEAIKGLVKGKLLSQDELERANADGPAVITYAERKVPVIV